MFKEKGYIHMNNILDTEKKLKILFKDWEFFANIFLNGIHVDYIFLHKEYGVIIINFCHLEDFEKKSNELYILQGSLYLNDGQKNFIQFILLNQNKSIEVENKRGFLVFNLDLFIKNFKPEIIVNDFDPVLANNLYKYIKSLIVWERSEENIVVRLTSTQKEIIETRTTSGRRRVKGAAGSGKTLVSSLRAARLVAEGKRVLFVTFNITLPVGIQRIVLKALNQPNLLGLSKNNIFSDINIQHFVFVHFHGLLARLRLLCSVPEITSLNLLDQRLPSLLIDQFVKNRAIFAGVMFDAIIVDEGQDFDISWISLLLCLLKDKGEFLFISDDTQDLYFQAKSQNPNAMKGCGFSGIWKKLEYSYRMPPEITRLSSKFAELFICPLYKDQEINLPKSDLSYIQYGLFGCKIKWFQKGEMSPGSFDLRNSIKIHILNELNNLLNNESLNLNEICLICNNKAFGQQIVTFLNSCNIYTDSTFSEDKNVNRREKFNFGSLYNSLKCTTVNSYKGLESRAIILVNVYNKNFNVSLKDHMVFYVGLTRVKESFDSQCYLIVINEIDMYNSFISEEIMKVNGELLSLENYKASKVSQVHYYEPVN